MIDGYRIDLCNGSASSSRKKGMLWEADSNQFTKFDIPQESKEPLVELSCDQQNLHGM